MCNMGTCGQQAWVLAGNPFPTSVHVTLYHYSTGLHDGSICPFFYALSSQFYIDHTTHIISTLQQSQIPEPHHGVDSRTSLYTNPSPKLAPTRAALSEACLALALLADGPMLFFRTLLSTHWDLAALQVFLEFNVLEAVPFHEPDFPAHSRR